MILSRNITTKIHFILDQILPPFLRDSKIFMYLPFRIMYGDKSRILFTFKEKSPFMNHEEFSKIYRDIDKLTIQRETDLNKGCIKKIIKNIVGNSILEVGCGKAFLSNIIERKGHSITAIDIYINNKIKHKYPKIIFVQGNIEHLPFDDNEFDTVICSKTLEHVHNLFFAMSELRRVCKKRLIIVVPKQRPYRYTFDLHLHFFPYKHSFLQVINPSNKNECKVIEEDIFYMEDK